MVLGNVTTIDSESAAMYELHRRGGFEDPALYALCRCAVLERVYGCSWCPTTTERIRRLREAELGQRFARMWVET